MRFLILFLSIIYCLGCSRSLTVCSDHSCRLVSRSNDIQDRINSGVDTIIFTQGKYYLKAPLVLRSNQVIQGEGEVTIIPLYNNSSIFVGRGIKNVKILDLELVGQGNYNPDWSGSSGKKERLVTLNSCTNVTLQNLYLINFGQAGIDIINGQDISIISNIIEGSHRNGARLERKNNFQFGISLAVSKNNPILNRIDIINNDISYTTQGIISSQSIFSDASNNITISDNDIHDIIGQHGIYLSTSNTSVINNEISNCGLEGIKIQASGSDINNCFVKNNIVKNCVHSQAYNITDITKGKHLINSVVFSNNVAVNCGRGLSIQGMVSNIDIDSMLIDGTTKQYGVYIKGDGLSNVSLRNVTINNAEHYDVLLNLKNEKNVNFDNLNIKNVKPRDHSIKIINGENISFNKTKVERPVSKYILSSKSKKVKIHK